MLPCRRRAQLGFEYFNVNDTVWSIPQPGGWAGGTHSTNHQKIAAHEYVHTWQGALGCVEYSETSLWFVEGMAEYIGYQTLVRDGLLSNDSVRALHVSGVRFSEPPLPTLKSMEVPGPDSGRAYSAFYLAIEQLVTLSDVTRLRSYCETVAAGQASAIAFRAAFGTSLDEFYSFFERYRAKLR